MAFGPTCRQFNRPNSISQFSPVGDPAVPNLNDAGENFPIRGQHRKGLGASNFRSRREKYGNVSVLRRSLRQLHVCCSLVKQCSSNTRITQWKQPTSLVRSFLFPRVHAQPSAEQKALIPLGACAPDDGVGATRELKKQVRRTTQAGFSSLPCPHERPPLESHDWASAVAD